MHILFSSKLIVVEYKDIIVKILFVQILLDLTVGFTGSELVSSYRSEVF